MNAIDKTLAERGKHYGKFENQAFIAQKIKVIFQATPQWFSLADDQREALDMIANKVARVLNGSPDYVDSWHDIAGYATLIVNRLSNSPATSDPNSMTEAAKLAGGAPGYVDRFLEKSEPVSPSEQAMGRDWLDQLELQPPISSAPQGCADSS